MAAWASATAHCIVGDISWSIYTRAAMDLHDKVVAALMEARLAPMSRGTDTKLWQQQARALLKPLKDHMDADEIAVVEQRLVGALIAANCRP